MPEAKDKSGDADNDQGAKTVDATLPALVAFLQGKYEDGVATIGEHEITHFERTVELLRGEPDTQLAYVSALTMRTFGHLLTKMSPDAEKVTFYIDGKSGEFIRWLMSKVVLDRTVPTDEGFYQITLSYPTPFYLLDLKPAAHDIVQELMLNVDHVPPVDSKPEGGIVFSSDHIKADRVEVRAVSNIPEVSPIFHEILQLIGAAYPESGLAALQASKGGRPTGGGHTADQLRLIKRVGELRAKGLSHAQIGDRVNLTRSRVSQICRENGFEKGVKGN
jgi:hypothetical protein